MISSDDIKFRQRKSVLAREIIRHTESVDLLNRYVYSHDFSHRDLSLPHGSRLKVAKLIVELQEQQRNKDISDHLMMIKKIELEMAELLEVTR